MERTIVLALLAVVLGGCSSISTLGITPPSMQDANTPKTSASQLEESLSNIAQCFHDAVLILQTEPTYADDGSVGNLAEFLQSAVKELSTRHTDTTGHFTRLYFDVTKTRLLTTSGEQVQCRIAGRSHDSYSDGSAALLTTYEFLVPGKKAVASTIVELSMK